MRFPITLDESHSKDITRIHTLLEMDFVVYLLGAIYESAQTAK